MLEQAINYPRNSDKALKTIIIGSLLTLFSFLLVPLLPVYGCLMNVLRSGMDHTEESPSLRTGATCSPRGRKRSVSPSRTSWSRWSSWE